MNALRHVLKGHFRFAIERNEVQEIIGFQPGGVCPFAVPENIPIWLDVSMKRFEYVHPAGGNEFTSVKITPEELERASGAEGWVDVCKGWDEYFVAALRAYGSPFWNLSSTFSTKHLKNLQYYI